MTFMLNFTIDCTPVGKGRPRFARMGNLVRTYNDKKTTDFEDIVRIQTLIAMGKSDPLETPVAVYLYFRLPIPQSYTKKRTEACLKGSERPKRPDIDNLAKSVLDGMNGVAFKDDSQIVSLHCTKTYAAEPGVDILVKEELE
jgi:Holliday junction resolvase RusA-like endonuclease